MLNLNDVTLLGQIEKIGDLKQPSYSMIEIVLNINTAIKDKDGKWSDKNTKVAVIFFGKPAEEIALLTVGTQILIKGEVSTRFNMRNGVEYANTSMQGKRYQVIAEMNPRNQAKTKVDNQQPLKLDDFEDDIPF